MSVERAQNTFQRLSVTGDKVHTIEEILSMFHKKEKTKKENKRKHHTQLFSNAMCDHGKYVQDGPLLIVAVAAPENFEKKNNNKKETKKRKEKEEECSVIRTTS